MNRYLGATAITLSMTGMAFAEAHSGAFRELMIEDGSEYLASDLMGTRIYALESEMDTGMVVAAGSAAEWDDIGEIGDVVISADGTLEAVVIDVGGFLGIGERHVAVSWDSIRPVTEDDDPSEVFLTIAATQEQLETAPEIMRASDAAMMDGDAVVETEAATDAMETDTETVVGETETEMAEVAEEVETETEEAMAETEEAVEGAMEETAEMADEAVAETEEAMAEVEEAAEADVTVTTESVEVESVPAEGDTAMVETETETEMAEAEVVEAEEADVVVVDGADREMLRTPMFEREGFVAAGMDELTTETMTGMRLYDSTDDDIGEISELIMSADGSTIEAAILDIGGFLGLGEHSIRVSLDEIQILRDEGGSYRAYIDATQEELEAQPEYEG